MSHELLHRLLDAPGATGSEGPVQRTVAREIGRYADDIRTDVHGNLYLGLNTDAPLTVMLAAHADQIGFMVQRIDDSGFVYIKNLGGPDEAILPGSRVLIRGPQGPVEGVIGKRAVHVQSMSEREKVPSLGELWIDIGAGSKKEAEEHVRPGDFATFTPRFTQLRNGRIASPALDDRAGLYVALETFRRCSRLDLRVALWVVSTVQEEIGLRGAHTAAATLRPDIAVAIDVATATDDPSGRARNVPDCVLGKGPCVSHGPNTHPVIERLLLDAADRRGIRVQRAPSADLEGNDAKALQVSGGGAAVASIGIPNRNMHTTAEVCDLRDIDDTVDLLVNFVDTLDLDVDLAPFKVPDARPMPRVARPGLQPATPRRPQAQGSRNGRHAPSRVDPASRGQ